jgi:hypothetical protein
MDIFDFLDALAKAEIPVADSESQDLEKELAGFE